MLALSKLLRRSQSLRLGASNAVYSKLDISLGERNSHIKPNTPIQSELSFPRFPNFYQSFSTERHSFSTDAGAKNVGEENVDPSSDSENEDELQSGDEGVELDLEAKKTSWELFQAMLSVPGLSVGTALDKWYTEEGKPIDRTIISNAILQLCRRRMYGRAFQMSQWVKNNKTFEFDETDYASRLHLTAKLYGIHKGEAYIENIPKSFRGETVYRTLLSNIVAKSNVRKAETVFNKMKELGFTRSSFAYDQMLNLYKRVDMKKITDVLSLMEKENVSPSLNTYKILIESSRDINKIEEIVGTMNNEGMKIDLDAKSLIARFYASAGFIEKAEKMLKEMEGESLEMNRYVCKHLLSIYGLLQREDDVRRIWKLCEENPRYQELIAAILAFGKIDKVKEAEDVFEKKFSMGHRVSSKIYSALLKVYVDHKMLDKGKELVTRLFDSGCDIRALTWDKIIKLYVEAGEVEKADGFLSKVMESKRLKPLMNSFMYVMNEYANKGDVYNAEKIFEKMKEAGYQMRPRQFRGLIRAYVKGKTPAYGMKDRLQANNIFPNVGLAAQLAKVDPFKKSPISDILV